jgi:hypothetical protein
VTKDEYEEALAKVTPEEAAAMRLLIARADSIESRLDMLERHLFSMCREDCRCRR